MIIFVNRSSYWRSYSLGNAGTQVLRDALSRTSHARSILKGNKRCTRQSIKHRSPHPPHKDRTDPRGFRVMCSILTAFFVNNRRTRRSIGSPARRILHNCSYSCQKKIWFVDIRKGIIKLRLCLFPSLPAVFFDTSVYLTNLWKLNQLGRKISCRLFFSLENTSEKMDANFQSIMQVLEDTFLFNFESGSWTTQIDHWQLSQSSGVDRSAVEKYASIFIASYAQRKL